MALFKRLQAIYGVRWDEQFPTSSRHDAAMVEWGYALAGFSGEQIKRGIDRARVECDWPPSIAKFVVLATEKPGCWEHAGAAYRPHRRALPKPKPCAAMVSAHLRTMRDALRG